MKLRLSLLAPAAALVLSCASPANLAQPLTGFAYSETALDAVLLKACTTGTTPADFDAVVLPPASRSAVPIDKLGKYVFGDEYVDSLADLGGPGTPAASTETNTWAPDYAPVSEIGRAVSGLTNDLVRKVYHVEDAASGNHNGKYHVYRYYPWQADVSTLTAQIWFGAGHVMYFNPVRGRVAAGAPTMELFPASPTSSSVAEVRFEGSSYYQFRSLYAGNTNQGGTDLGSPLSKVQTVLGDPTSTKAVATQGDVVWSDRNILYTYPNGAYIHYSLNDGTKVRLFFWGADAASFRLIAMYFVKN